MCKNKERLLHVSETSSLMLGNVSCVSAKVPLSSGKLSKLSLMGAPPTEAFWVNVCFLVPGGIRHVWSRMCLVQRVSQ